nr:formylglycine-generating enzyme family protein [Planctomycetota bacterium]
MKLSGMTILASAFLLSGCGGGGSLGKSVGNVSPDYIVVDLHTGTSTVLAELPAMSGDMVATKMVFRRIDSAVAKSGSLSGQPNTETDEQPVQTVAVPEYFIAVSELTQSQWKTIAGGEPWLDAAFLSSYFPGDEAPAVAINRADIYDAINGWNAGRTNLNFRLPTDVEWEHACRGGSTTLFSWGDDPSPDTGAQYAHVSRPVGVGSGAGSTSTMDKVASLEANAFGLYDMHGSVWEWTSTGLD